MTNNNDRISTENCGNRVGAVYHYRTKSVALIPLLPCTRPREVPFLDRIDSAVDHFDNWSLHEPKEGNWFLIRVVLLAWQCIFLWLRNGRLPCYCDVINGFRRCLRDTARKCNCWFATMTNRSPGSRVASLGLIGVIAGRYSFCPRRCTSPCA